MSIAFDDGPFGDHAGIYVRGHVPKKDFHAMVALHEAEIKEAVEHALDKARDEIDWERAAAAAAEEAVASKIRDVVRDAVSRARHDFFEKIDKDAYEAALRYLKSMTPHHEPS